MPTNRETLAVMDSANEEGKTSQDEVMGVLADEDRRLKDAEASEDPLPKLNDRYQQNIASKEQQTGAAVDAALDDKPYVHTIPKANQGFVGVIDGKQVRRRPGGGLEDFDGNAVDTPEGLAGEFAAKETVSEPDADGNVTITGKNGGTVTMPKEKYDIIKARRSGGAAPARNARGTGGRLSDQMGGVTPAVVTEGPDGKVIESNPREARRTSMIEKAQVNIDKLAALPDKENDDNGFRRPIQERNRISFAVQSKEGLADRTNAITEQELSLNDFTADEMKEYQKIARDTQNDPFKQKQNAKKLEEFMDGVENRIIRQQKTRTDSATAVITRKQDLAISSGESANKIKGLENTYRENPSKENLGKLQESLANEAEIAEATKLSKGTERDYGMDIERGNRSIIAAQRSIDDINQKAIAGAAKEIADSGYIAGENDAEIAKINARFTEQARRLTGPMEEIKGRLEKTNAGFQALDKTKGSAELRNDSKANNPEGIAKKPKPAPKKTGLRDDNAPGLSTKEKVNKQQAEAAEKKLVKELESNTNLKPKDLSSGMDALERSGGKESGYSGETDKQMKRLWKEKNYVNDVAQAQLEDEELARRGFEYRDWKRAKIRMRITKAMNGLTSAGGKFENKKELARLVKLKKQELNKK